MLLRIIIKIKLFRVISKQLYFLGKKYEKIEKIIVLKG